MSNTFSGEEILCKVRRNGSYIIHYIPFLIIFAALAAAPWVLPRFIPNGSSVVGASIALISLPVIKISICAVFGIIFVILLIAAINNLTAPCLLVTEKRVCLFKGSKKYREARIDKIDAFKVSEKSIAVYAGGRRVFSFGPINNAKAVRDTIVLLIEGEYRGEDTYSHQEKPSAYSEPESISKSGDVLDEY